MANKIPVSAVFDNIEMMLRDHWGYIYGKAGILWTEEKQRNIEARYSEDDPKYGKAVKYGRKWIGHIVVDCSGVLVYIGNLFGIKYPHGSSSMVRDGYIYDCGPTPHPGWAALVDPTPDTYDNNHIGYVGRDGVTVYEAQGTVAGFTTSKVTDKKWTKFGKIKYVDYSDEEVTPVPPVSDVYFAVITGDNVRLRSGPGTNYAKVGTDNLFNGAEVEVLADCDNWKFCRVLADGRQGYVFSKYVSGPIEKPEEKPAEEPVATDEYVMVNKDDFLELIRTCKKIAEKYSSVLELYGGDVDGKVSD